MNEITFSLQVAVLGTASLDVFYVDALVNSCCPRLECRPYLSKTTVSICFNSNPNLLIRSSSVVDSSLDTKLRDYRLFNT